MSVPTWGVRDCGGRCVRAALSAAQGCLRCAPPLVQKAFPHDQEGALPRDPKESQHGLSCHLRQSPRERSGKGPHTCGCVLSFCCSPRPETLTRGLRDVLPGSGSGCV